MSCSILLTRVIKLYKLFQNGKIPTLAQHEVHPDLPLNDRLRYLYFTLPPSLNFQRSSPAMWQAALKTWNDTETNYLYYPEKVILVSRDRVQKDLTKYKLALQKNKHTDIWIKLCQTFSKYYSSDPRELFTSCDCDVEKILELIQINMSKDFPYLRGLKMANYWLYILQKYTNLRLKNRHLISIIPDTHVIQCSIKLGLVEKADSVVVARAWQKLLQNSQISPVDMHPVLWNWSRNNFQPEV